MDEKRGQLFVVATPIGNLEDMTYRAVRTLKDVDAIIAEDTRRSQKLLNHYGIDTPFTKSYYEGVSEERIERFLSQLDEGYNLALISDAGTPLISDPGYELIKRAVRSQIKIIPVPGPSAVSAAVSVSGQPSDSFVFEGMIPKKKNQKRKIIQRLKTEQKTVVFYESPHRIKATLNAFSDILPHRRMTVCRELTKQHEQILEGESSELNELITEQGLDRGEITLVVSGASDDEIKSYKQNKYKDIPVENQVKGMKLLEGLTEKGAMKKVAQLRGVSKREIYNTIVQD